MSDIMTNKTFLSKLNRDKGQGEFGTDKRTTVRACSMHSRDEKSIKNFGWKSLKGTDHSEDVGVDGKIISEWILGKLSGKVWTGCMKVRTGTNDRLL
jgi:ribosomal protein S26